MSASDPKTTESPLRALQEGAMRGAWQKHFRDYDEKAVVRFSTYDMEKKDAEIKRLRARLSKIQHAPVPPDNEIAMLLKAWAAPRDGEPSNDE